MSGRNDNTRDAGRSRGRGLRGRGRGRVASMPIVDGPVEKTLPNFVKVKSLRAGTRSYDVVVQVCEVEFEATKTERRRLRTVTSKCTRAVVGDETGCITLYIRQPETSDLFKEGNFLLLLNTKMHRGGDDFWLEADNWSAVKKMEGNEQLLPAEFPPFTANKDVDCSKKAPIKPEFSKVDALEPESKGVAVIVKVAEVREGVKSKGPSTLPSVEAVVADETAAITVLARGQNVAALQKDAVVAILNAKILMLAGHMKLSVDRWSSVKPLELVDKALLPGDFVGIAAPALANDKSAVEWELV
eukprot:NODE_600_length_2061_cov_146.156064_g554_i0.p1 GENE.NODE_600_length_2061_cov_146.156064_g554_i0~~NODE_600_length_2061_cov_146.156064_g554_i0.p1  ORF type:complete len:321 (+),score=49.29 NODE_600_length_2061_cov_146.156064_g554_i0:61-963(+)